MLHGVVLGLCPMDVAPTFGVINSRMTNVTFKTFKKEVV